MQKDLILLSALAFFLSLFLAFGWSRASPMRVEDLALSRFNSGQACQVDADCGRSGCSGEICGRDGPVTVCSRPPEFWQRFEGRKCLCVQGTCKWAKSVVNVWGQ